MRKLTWILALMLLPMVRLPGQAQVHFYFVDVEGGGATLIVTPAGESVLIDCGAPGKRDAARIHQVATQVAHIKAIDHLIATHWHSDHFGGTPDLAKLMPIHHFYNRGIPKQLIQDEPVLYPKMIKAYKEVTRGKATVLKAGDMLPLKQKAGTPTFSILTVCGSAKFLPDKAGAPKNPFADEFTPMEPDPSDNAQSLGFVLSYGGFRFMDLGDLTWNMEYKLIAPTNKVGTVEVFQSTHHGLEISNNSVLIKSVNPRVAVFNNGPHKGGNPIVIAALRELPDIQAIYQLHQNLGATAQENTNPAYIANTADPCKGEFIQLAVAPDSKSYTVAIGSKGTPKHFKTRMAKK